MRDEYRFYVHCFLTVGFIVYMMEDSESRMLPESQELQGFSLFSVSN